MGMGSNFDRPFSSSTRRRSVDRRAICNAKYAFVRQRPNTECRFVCFYASRCLARKLGCDTARYSARSKRRPEIASLQGSIRILEHGNAIGFPFLKGSRRKEYAKNFGFQSELRRSRKSLRIIAAASLSSLAAISFLPAPDFHNCPRAS